MTSTVFGTLIAARAWDVLAAWLACGRNGDEPIGPLVPDIDEDDIWFWPRLDMAEPDVVVRLGSTLVLVEAKYDANMGGASTAQGQDGPPVNQLCREWRALQPASVSPRYPARLRALVADPSQSRALVYLVRGAQRTRSSQELAASRAQEPGSRMFLLSWEDLHRVLADHPGARWSRDLRAYLEERRVWSFRGFGHTVSTSDSAVANSRALASRLSRPMSYLDWSAAFAATTEATGLRHALAVRLPGAVRWQRIAAAFAPATAAHLHQLAIRHPTFLEDVHG